MKEYTYKEIRRVVDYGVWSQVNKWLKRGDGIAVYQNAALDSSGAGHYKFLSFGSSAAQLETDRVESLPTRLPDMAGQINWMYQLQGTYKGQELEHDSDCRYVNDIMPPGEGVPHCKCHDKPWEDEDV